MDGPSLLQISYWTVELGDHQLKGHHSDRKCGLQKRGDKEVQKACWWDGSEEVQTFLSWYLLSGSLGLAASVETTPDSWSSPFLLVASTLVIIPSN